MIALPYLPSWAWKVGAGIALAAGAYFYVQHEYDEGYAAGVAAQKLVGDEALNLANDKNRDLEGKLRDAADARNTERTTDNAKYAKELERIRAAGRAGTERLSIPAAARACPGPAGAPTNPAPGPRAEERADLMPGTADAVLRIAGGARQLVQDYNDLLAEYNAKTCQ